MDIFGGSGPLSHTVKCHFPNARVIWNDYDGYVARLEAIPGTNVLLDALRPILYDVPRKTKLSDACRLEVLKVIRDHEQTNGYVDYITISASLLFSAKYAVSYDQLSREGMYNRLRSTPYDATGYLTGVVFLVDPPYLSTDTSTYNDNYWKLKDYLDVLSFATG